MVLKTDHEFSAPRRYKVVHHSDQLLGRIGHGDFRVAKVDVPVIAARASQRFLTTGLSDKISAARLGHRLTGEDPLPIGRLPKVRLVMSGGRVCRIILTIVVEAKHQHHDTGLESSQSRRRSRYSWSVP